MGKTYVIIPACNEEKRLPNILKTMEQCINKKIIDNVIIVNDGSTDKTREIIKRFSEKSKKITGIEFKKNVGMGGAIMKAIDVIHRNADAEVIAKIDADLKGLTVEHVEKLINPIKTKKTPLTIANFAHANRSGIRAYRADFILSIVRNQKNSAFLKKIGSKFDTALIVLFRLENNGKNPEHKVIKWENVDHLWVGEGDTAMYRSVDIAHNPRKESEEQLFKWFVKKHKHGRRL